MQQKINLIDFKFLCVEILYSDWDCRISTWSWHQNVPNQTCQRRWLSRRVLLLHRLWVSNTWRSLFKMPPTCLYLPVSHLNIFQNFVWVVGVCGTVLVFVFRSLHCLATSEMLMLYHSNVQDSHCSSNHCSEIHTSNFLNGTLCDVGLQISYLNIYITIEMCTMRARL